MKIGILTLAVLVTVLFVNMLFGAPTNQSRGTNHRTTKLVSRTTAKSGKMIIPANQRSAKLAPKMTTKSSKTISQARPIVVPATSTKSGKMMEMANMGKHSATTTKKSATGKTGRATTTHRTMTTKKTMGPAGKTTPKKAENLKDTRRTTKSSKPTGRPTIKTPFGTMEDIIPRPFPPSQLGNGKAQPYSIPGIMYSSPFFHQEFTSLDLLDSIGENTFDMDEPPKSRNVTTTTSTMAPFDNSSTAVTENFANVTTVQYDNDGTTTASTQLSIALEENGAEMRFPEVTEGSADWNSTTLASTSIASPTKKRLKRKRTTIGSGADLTTRKRLKRKRTTTVATPSENGGEYYED